MAVISTWVALYRLALFQGASPGNDGLLDVTGMMYFGGYPGELPFPEVTRR